MNPTAGIKCGYYAFIGYPDGQPYFKQVAYFSAIMKLIRRELQDEDDRR